MADKAEPYAEYVAWDDAWRLACESIMDVPVTTTDDDDVPYTRLIPNGVIVMIVHRVFEAFKAAEWRLVAEHSDGTGSAQ